MRIGACLCLYARADDVIVQPCGFPNHKLVNGVLLHHGPTCLQPLASVVDMRLRLLLANVNRVYVQIVARIRILRLAPGWCCSPAARNVNMWFTQLRDHVWRTARNVMQRLLFVCTASCLTNGFSSCVDVGVPPVFIKATH